MDYSREQLARIWLQCLPMGAWNRRDALIERFGSAEAVWDHFTPALYDSLGPEYFAFLADTRMNRCADALRLLDSLGARAVFRGDNDYPALLAAVGDAPDVLFVLGTLPRDDVPAVAIVGSRRSTRYGTAQAKRIAGELADAGAAVISGMARGIDAAAHVGALDHHGVTVAVLGSGLAHIYPPENKDLFARIIAEGGAVVSELHPDFTPMPYHFPVRNRIISGLSHALLLIEAQEQSGTHSTVNHALDQGREVFALPGNVDAPGSALPLKLLKDGANLCTCGEDILAAMGWRRSPPEQTSFFAPDTGEESDPVLRALGMEEKTLEELIAETGLNAQELGTQLTLLELGGKVERRAGRAYALVR